MADSIEVEEEIEGDGKDLDIKPEMEKQQSDLFSENNSQNQFSDTQDAQVDNVDNDNDNSRTQHFSSFAKYELEILGEHAPYDRYIVEDEEVFIGRDSKSCQIVLTDKEVSSIHTVIRKKAGVCEIEDLKSANGTILNGKRINKSLLSHNDEFIIGTTTFTLKIISDLLNQEEGRLMPVEKNQHHEIKEEVDLGIDFSDKEGQLQDISLGTQEESTGGDAGGRGGRGKESFIKQAIRDPSKRRILMYGSVALFLIYILSNEDPNPKKNENAAKSQEQKSNLLKEAKEKEKKEAEEVVKEEKKSQEKELSPEKRELLESTYLLAKNFFNQGKYSEAIFELEKIFFQVPDYKNSKQLHQISKQGLARLEELEKKRQEEIDNKLRMKKVKELITKGKGGGRKKKSRISRRSFFSNIAVRSREF